MNGELLSSFGWWYEGEFLLPLVGGMNGKLPNDIRVRVVHFITWLWHEDEFLLHLVGGMSGKLPNDIRVRVIHFITWLMA